MINATVRVCVAVLHMLSLHMEDIFGPDLRVKGRNLNLTSDPFLRGSCH